MRNIFLFCLLCCSTAMAQVVAIPEKSNSRNEASSRWEAIQWQPDAASALRESNSSGKPLMVFLIVNYRGKADADKV